MSAGLFKKLYQSGVPFALVDCRERRDFVDGHWFGSTNIPLSDLTNNIRRLVPETTFPIHVLDWQTRASHAAIARLKNLGYQAVTIHKTAHPGEMGQGFVRGEYVWSKAFGEVVAHCANLPEVTPADYIADYQDALLFDVRPTAEYRDFTMPGSQSLPNSLLLANADALHGTGKMALLHCAGRTRSIIGGCTLKAAGYDGPFAIFKGGTQAWQLDGYEREHNANRIFAADSESSHMVETFLKRWHIPFTHIAPEGRKAFVESHGESLKFDVSDDAATGQRLAFGVVKISGTNLIQQTDRSIARYHVPVVLFDRGSGSRAAFAAYWLRAMGFSVQVALLAEPFDPEPADEPVITTPMEPVEPMTHAAFTAALDRPVSLLDFRPSSAYRKGHLKTGEWANISAVLEADADSAKPLLIIADTHAKGVETVAALVQAGWPIAGIYIWRDADFDPAQLVRGGNETPLDESALFAGRHHGILQDARDYLAWEEDLPAEIDQEIHQMWHDFLCAEPAGA
jgi:cystathionine beta-lyase